MPSFRHDNDTETFAATAAVERGDLLTTPSTKVGIATGPAAIGEMVGVTVRGRVGIPNPDGLSFAGGAAIGYDAVNGKATAAAGGTFDVGPAVDTYTGADAEVQAYLNG